MRSAMNRQSTSIGRSSTTFTTHLDVSQAHGHTGSQKNSRSATPSGLPGGRDQWGACHGTRSERGRIGRVKVLLVGLAGAAGALSRYGLGVAVGVRSFPWGTLGINLVGSYLLG